MRQPLVLVTTDVRVGDGYRWHSIPETYLEAIAEGAGLAALGLPSLQSGYDLDGLLDRVDGVVMTGARSNVHPARYGEAVSKLHEPFDEDRDAMSLRLAAGALEKRLPMLCICRGMQELNVALGGTLATEIHDLAGRMDHRAPSDAAQTERYALRHTVNIRPDGILHRCFERDSIEVNSLHGQAIDRLAASLTIEAVAADGTIEAVSMGIAAQFVLGVQWHPEYWYRTDFPSARIFKAFGDAVRG